MQFHEPGIFNYSALLLSEDEDTLFVGAREAVFALNAHNISKKQHEVWCGLPVPLLFFFPAFPPQVHALGSSWGGSPFLGCAASPQWPVPRAIRHIQRAASLPTRA